MPSIEMITYTTGSEAKERLGRRVEKVDVGGRIGEGGRIRSSSTGGNRADPENRAVSQHVPTVTRMMQACGEYGLLGSAARSGRERRRESRGQSERERVMQWMEQ